MNWREPGSAGLAGAPFWEPMAVLAILAGLVVSGLSQDGMPLMTVPGGLRAMALLVASGWLLLRQTASGLCTVRARPVRFGRLSIH